MWGIWFHEIHVETPSYSPSVLTSLWLAPLTFRWVALRSILKHTVFISWTCRLRCDDFMPQSVTFAECNLFSIKNRAEFCYVTRFTVLLFISLNVKIQAKLSVVQRQTGRSMTTGNLNSPTPCWSPSLPNIPSLGSTDRQSFWSLKLAAVAAVGIEFHMLYQREFCRSTVRVGTKNLNHIVEKRMSKWVTAHTFVVPVSPLAVAVAGFGIGLHVIQKAQGLRIH